jgi:asparagine synthetase B (glutamine-hydrolysing)
MCGIFCHIGRLPLQTIPGQHEELLRKRGPDSLQCHSVRAGEFCVFFAASVLSLRYPFVPQPLIDASSGSVFCWNGEAWKTSGHALSGNDSRAVFEMLLSCAASDSYQTEILRVFGQICGPYAFIFYDAVHQDLYYGRDCLGRRSLLSKSIGEDDVILSSVGDWKSDGLWTEVDADGMYVMSLKSNNLHTTHFPLCYDGDILQEPCLVRRHYFKRLLTLQRVPYTRLNHSLPEDPVPLMTLQSNHLQELDSLLVQSLSLRLKSLPGSHTVPVAVLFSGGLDSTLLAYYSHLILPPDTPIDLVNVAFQNPRVHRDPSKDPYSQCPDRQTGLSAWSTLCRLCPERQFRMISVNVPYEELQQHIPTIQSLMQPHNTEMDLSIASALYFAAKASGTMFAHADSTGEQYTSPSRILISGLGADELFAGYNRHAIAFSRKGFPGLLEELELDFNRLGRRNLGRDDRVTSHWSKEVRYPFLDEDLVGWAVNAPVWQKCGFGMELGSGTNDDPDIEPGKLALRLLAWKAGMKDVAKEKKRAVSWFSVSKHSSDDYRFNLDHGLQRCILANPKAQIHSFELSVESILNQSSSGDDNSDTCESQVSCSHALCLSMITGHETCLFTTL